MATNVGRVGMVTKGAWINSATYEVLDVVTYNNGLYIAKQAVPANTLPTNTTYWQMAISYIQTYTITRQTDAAGVAGLGATITQRNILSIVAEDKRYIIIPFLYDNVWHAKVTDVSGNPVASTSIDFTYTYI